VITVWKFLYGLFNAIFFVRPFSQINHFATLAAKWTKAIGGIPHVLFTALRAGNNGSFGSIGHKDISKIK
jgi:hypothetical protein